LRDKDEEEDLGLGLKSVWYAAEALGNVIGATKGDKQESANSSAAPTASSSFSASNLPLPRRKALELLRADYDVDYFISGLGEMRAYADDCEFRDPFAGFKGTARFKKNVSNLGSSLEEAETILLSWEEREEEGSLKTQWRFSGIVGLLPWRPRLAAAGSTTHVFDPVSLRRGLSSLKRESREGEKEKRTKKKNSFLFEKKTFPENGPRHETHRGLGIQPLRGREILTQACQQAFAGKQVGGCGSLRLRGGLERPLVRLGRGSCQGRRRPLRGLERREASSSSELEFQRRFPRARGSRGRAAAAGSVGGRDGGFGHSGDWRRERRQAALKKKCFFKSFLSVC